MINFTQDEVVAIMDAINSYYQQYKLPQANGASIVRYELNKISQRLAVNFWISVTLGQKSNNSDVDDAIDSLLTACRTQTMPTWGYKGT